MATDYKVDRNERPGGGGDYRPVSQGPASSLFNGDALKLKLKSYTIVLQYRSALYTVSPSAGRCFRE